jgi:hypothetical protein
MIEKVVRKKKLTDSDYQQDLEYWLSRTPAERVSFVEELRREIWGSAPRRASLPLRYAVVIKRPAI